MDANQKVKLAMYNVVISFCDKNMPVISAIPALQASYTSFTQTVTAITNTVQQKMEVLTGIAADKSAARKTLVKEAAALAATVFAYANASSLGALKDKVNFSLSDLNRLKDVELPAVCKNILKAASENITALAAYNVTGQTNSLNLLITAYETIEPNPRAAVSERVVHNVSLKELYKTADNVLKNEMDKMISGNADTNPDFFTGYMSTRALVDASTTSSQIKGTVTDKVSGAPVNNADVFINNTDITVITNGKGKFVIKQLAPGPYTVIISKRGYEAVTFSDILVKLGQITKVKALLPVANEEAAGEKKVN